eukprot:GFKZ01008657.1.p1 GENE.GFKZ01008657.1~~GFKZ01008657.1.p1  ORF type:complete len:283 (-),score=36.94 GFKZ01008657.1:1131-1871(-)
MPKRPSASRRWCKVCKIWLADNRIQREQHEQGPKHKAALQALLAEIAARNEKKAKAQALAIANQRPVSPHAQDKSATASIAQQLLDRAARGPQGEVGNVVLEAAADAEAAQLETAAWQGQAGTGPEMLDSNGYPLPVSAVYGKWETVEEEGEEEAEAGQGEEVGGQGGHETENGEKGDEGAGAKETRGSHKRGYDEMDDDAGAAGSGTLSRVDVGAGGERAEDSGVVVFKRRSAPRWRRIRKRGRR